MARHGVTTHHHQVIQPLVYSGIDDIGIDDVLGVEAFDEDGALGSLPHLLLVGWHCFGGKVDLGTKSTYSYVGFI